jgi:hypothetical protein
MLALFLFPLLQAEVDQEIFYFPLFLHLPCWLPTISQLPISSRFPRVGFLFFCHLLAALIAEHDLSLLSLSMPAVMYVQKMSQYSHIKIDLVMVWG